MGDGASGHDIQQVESQNNKVIAGQNIKAGNGCPGARQGLFNSSPDSTKSANKTAEKKCPEVKNGQSVKCPGCKEIVKAIVPSKEKIYCSNAACKLAAPHLKGKKQPTDNRQEHDEKPIKETKPTLQIESTPEVPDQIRLQKVKRQVGEAALAIA